MFKTDVNLSVIDKYSGGKILSLRKDRGMEKYNQITIENILADKEECCAYEDKLVIVRFVENKDSFIVRYSNSKTPCHSCSPIPERQRFR